MYVFSYALCHVHNNLNIMQCIQHTASWWRIIYEKRQKVLSCPWCRSENKNARQFRSPLHSAGHQSPAHIKVVRECWDKFQFAFSCVICCIFLFLSCIFLPQGTKQPCAVVQSTWTYVYIQHGLQHSCKMLAHTDTRHVCLGCC
jgi:hypothetical protein